MIHVPVEVGNGGHEVLEEVEARLGLYAELEVARGEGPGPALGRHVLCARQQSLREELEGPRDDDGDRGGHLPDLLVALHDLLNPCLRWGEEGECWPAAGHSTRLRTERNAARLLFIFLALLGAIFTGGNLALYFFFLPGMLGGGGVPGSAPGQASRGGQAGSVLPLGDTRSHCCLRLRGAS